MLLLALGLLLSPRAEALQNAGQGWWCENDTSYWNGSGWVVVAGDCYYDPFNGAGGPVYLYDPPMFPGPGSGGSGGSGGIVGIPVPGLASGSCHDEFPLALHAANILFKAYWEAHALQLGVGPNLRSYVIIFSDGSHQTFKWVAPIQSSVAIEPIGPCVG